MKRKKSFSFFDFLAFLLIGAIGGAIIYFFGYREYRINQAIYLEQRRLYNLERAREQELQVKTRDLRNHIRGDVENNEEITKEFFDLD